MSINFKNDSSGSCSNYYSYERMDSQYGGSCSSGDLSDNRMNNAQQNQPISNLDSLPSFDSAYCGWNSPKLRSPISNELLDYILNVDNDFIAPLTSPNTAEPVSPIMSESRFSEYFRILNNNNGRLYNLNDSRESYEEVRRHFEANGKNVDDTMLIQFTPNSSNCSTPCLTRKPLSEVDMSELQYFAPQNPLETVDYEQENIQNYCEERHTKVLPKYKGKPKQKEMNVDYCVFCFNNHEHEMIYKSHTVKDSKGRVLCPRLRVYVCPICGKDGDEAHTTKYCKQRKAITPEDLAHREENRRRKCSTNQHTAKYIQL